MSIHRYFYSGLFFLTLLHGAASAQTPDADKSAVWQKVRSSFFNNQAIASNQGVLELEAPARAEDAAIVPIAIRAQLAQTPEHYISKIWLVIDDNPSPIAAVFQFTPESGKADIETRVRVEQYTFIRAIAQTNDGALFMATRYVKASGGCSAPAGKDAAAALANLGRTRFQVAGAVTEDHPVLAQFMISHPNSSGLAMDQVTRLYEPAYYVRKFTVTYAGKIVMTADVDFSISENPNFRFYFIPRAGGGELKAEVIDTKDLKYESRVHITTTPVGAG
ncbi:MAG: quinoprotein dehydrogenase-associated SoxYZ-like carrier [Burkholderiaceae bacterium]|jgi:sulfur-oxidizing protein SoxY